MGTSTRLNMRDLLSQAVGDYQSLSTSGAGNTSSTSLVDSALPDLTEEDDGLDAEWVHITSGGNSDEQRRIKTSGGYTGSSTTITVTRKFTTDVASGVTYELHRIDPVMKHNAIDRAIEELYPSDGRRGLYLPVFDETLVIDNRLDNFDFETNTGGTVFSNWSTVNAPTLSTDTSIKMHGLISAQMVAGTGGTAQMTQTLTINVQEITDQAMVLRVMAYTTGTDAARVGVDWDGGTTIDFSDYHTGEDEWQDLYVNVNVPGTATQVKVLLEGAASQTVRWDMAYLSLGKIHRYTIPTTIITGPYRVEMQNSRAEPNGPYYAMGPENMPVPGRIMRLRGMNLLSRPSTDSGTTEIDGARLNVIVQYSAGVLFEMLAGQASGSERDELLGRSARRFRRADQLLSSAGIGMRVMSAEYPTGVWHSEEDGVTRELVLHER